MAFARQNYDVFSTRQRFFKKKFQLPLLFILKVTGTGKTRPALYPKYLPRAYFSIVLIFST